MTGGRFAAHVLEISSGAQRKIAQSDREEIVAFWSKDGEWIVCEVDSEEGKGWNAVG